MDPATIAASLAALLDCRSNEDAFRIIAKVRKSPQEAPLARLVPPLLAAGEITQARIIAEAISDPPQRAQRLAEVARGLVASGRRDAARETIATALELSGTFRDRWSAARFLETVAAVLGEAEDCAALERLAEWRWLAAPTRSDLLVLIPLAGPLVSRQPDLALRICESFHWVEQTLLAA